MKMKKLLLSSLLMICNQSQSDMTRKLSQVDHERIQYKKAGIGLITLGVLGNLIAYINSIEPEPGSQLKTIQNICSYSVPEYSCDPGIAQTINGFCTQFWQKSLFFTLAGILPGAFLLWTTQKIKNAYQDDISA